MIGNFSAHISKWELVCKFGVIFHISIIISCLSSWFNAWNWWFFYSIITFSYTKYFVHSYTVDAVFTLSYQYIVYQNRRWDMTVIYNRIFSCDQAALWMVFSVRLSVCPSVCLSVCPSVCPSVCLSVCPSVLLSHLFDYVPIIVSSWNFQELSHWTRVRSMQKVMVKGQRSRSQRSRPKFSFPDCNSSLNSHMMIKLYI